MEDTASPGRPPLDPDDPTVKTTVRLPESLLDWAKDKAARVADERGIARGTYGLSAYVREALEARRRRDR